MEPGRGKPAYGQDATQAIVAVERLGENKMRVYRRLGTEVEATTDPLVPWLILSAPDHLTHLPKGHAVEELAGEGYGFLVRFPGWESFLEARKTFRDQNIDFFAYSSPVEQYLTLTGRNLFRGLHYDDLHRLQLDIETLTLDPRATNARIILIALRDNKDFERVISGKDMSEREMLEELSRLIRSLDPDVIEGHNIFEFDLAYIAGRAEHYGMHLPWGRDGSELYIGSRGSRYKVGARTSAYLSCRIYGRHIIDTLHQVQRYDVAGRMDSYGLKAVIEEMGLTRPDRTFVDWRKIPELWDSDPQLLVRYALDDVRDVDALSSTILPTEFYQAQIVPWSYQDIATGGTGERINALLVRAYLQAGRAIPLPRQAIPYPGGYTEVRAIGLFRPVVKCDIESLYPAIMLNYRIAPASDTLGIFLSMLKKLTEQRLEAKAKARDSQGREKTYWEALQRSLKVLINSFYGYLGYPNANFNDYDAAAQVTQRGQEIIKKVMEHLERARCRVIEVDTDGVYFVPPSDAECAEAAIALVDRISRNLPTGIRLNYEGYYTTMVSLKSKNYILIDESGEVTIKGSSLRSRRDERFLRQFIRDAASLLARGSLTDIGHLYREVANKIKGRQLTIGDFSRWETVTEKTFQSSNLRRLATAAQGARPGDRVQVYQRKDGSLALANNYAGDEDVAYLLRRLRDMAGRFRELCSSDDEFESLFPLMKDESAVEGQQLSLF